MIKNKIAKLINVKSIITILLTLVFSYLCVTEKISSSEFIPIFSTIIAFYFGTQVERKNSETEKNDQEQE